MNGERQWWMSRILYISAANYDWKHLENSKIGLENFWIFLPKQWEPCEITDEISMGTGEGNAIHSFVLFVSTLTFESSDPWPSACVRRRMPEHLCGGSVTLMFVWRSCFRYVASVCDVPAADRRLPGQTQTRCGRTTSLCVHRVVVWWTRVCE